MNNLSWEIYSFVVCSQTIENKYHTDCILNSILFWIQVRDKPALRPRRRHPVPFQSAHQWKHALHKLFSCSVPNRRNSSSRFQSSNLCSILYIHMTSLNDCPIVTLMIDYLRLVIKDISHCLSNISLRPPHILIDLVVRNSCFGGGWGGEERDGPQGMFHKDHEFHLNIHVEPNGYRVRTPYIFSCRLPLAYFSGIL